MTQILLKSLERKHWRALKMNEYHKVEVFLETLFCDHCFLQKPVNEFCNGNRLIAFYIIVQGFPEGDFKQILVVQYLLFQFNFLLLTTNKGLVSAFSLFVLISFWTSTPHTLGVAKRILKNRACPSCLSEHFLEIGSLHFSKFWHGAKKSLWSQA